MLIIGARGSPFKIFDSVIPLIPVYVVNYHMLGGVRNKRFCHKPMDFLANPFSVFTQGNRRVTVAIVLRLEYTTPNTPNLTQVADFV